MTVVGWCDLWNDTYPTAPFTEERQRALAERVRKRQYNFSYQAFMNPYMTPVYDDNAKCLLTKPQWDSVLADAYGEQKMPMRSTPLDVLTIKKYDVLWEKEKFVPKDGDENG